MPVCVGDCNGNGVVTIDEILRVVGIDLGDLPLATCTAADGDGSGDVTIDEIIQAVANALNGCPVVGTGERRPGPRDLRQLA